MIGLYSVCWNSHAADMWEHYRFVELLLRKYTIVSVAAWDWAVRSLSRLGEWHKGTLFSELCHAGGETNRGRPPMVTTTVLVSRHLVRAMYVAMAKIVGFVIRAQPPGKKDHLLQFY
eukprot:g54100.t1